MRLLKFAVATGMLVMPVLNLAGTVPSGWLKAGDHPEQYDMGIEPGMRHEGHAVAFIKGTAERFDGFGTFMQMASASEYLGKRIRLSADVKADIDTGWAGLWLRLDGTDPRRPLGFDNMQSRPITGTTGWKRVTVVLDVPQDTTAMGFGLLLSGGGEVRMSDLKLEIVSSDVPVTGSHAGGRQLAPPQNLDLED